MKELGQRSRRRRLRLFPRQGYVLLLVGILVGFLVFTVVSWIFPRGGPGDSADGGLPTSIEFEFLYTSEREAGLDRRGDTGF